MARRAAGSETINIAEGDAVEAIRAMTGGRGADLCVDAVGMEAERSPLDKLSNVINLKAGSIKALNAAVSAVRRGGVVSVVGVYGMPYDKFPLGQIFDKGISLYFGQAPVQTCIDELLVWVTGRRIQRNECMIHRLPL